jgi:hypothetical protein
MDSILKASLNDPRRKKNTHVLIMGGVQNAGRILATTLIQHSLAFETAGLEPNFEALE